MLDGKKRRLEWARAARAAYEATLDRIMDEDPFTARLVAARVAKSLDLVLLQPGIGSPGNVSGQRVHAVPRTGHSFNYRVTPEAIYIVRWYRQRQNILR